MARVGGWDYRYTGDGNVHAVDEHPCEFVILQAKSTNSGTVLVGFGGSTPYLELGPKDSIQIEKVKNSSLVYYQAVNGDVVSVGIFNNG